MLDFLRKCKVIDILLPFLLSISFLINIVYSIGFKVLYVEIGLLNIILNVLAHFVLKRVRFKKTAIVIYFLSLSSIWILFMMRFSSLNALLILKSQIENRAGIGYVELVLFTSLLSIILSFCSYFFFSYKFNFYMIVVLGFSMFAVQELLELVTSTVSFFLFSLIAITAFLKYIYLKKLKTVQNEFVGKSSFLFYIFPLVIIMLIFVFIIPSDSKPFRLILFYIDEDVESKSELSDFFFLSFTGFAKREKLGGDININNKAVIDISAKKPVYLRGFVSDYYNGKNWNEKPIEDFGVIKEKVNSDVIETIIGLSILKNVKNSSDFDNVLDIIDYQNLKVTYRDIETKSLFTPLKTINVISSLSYKKIGSEIYTIANNSREGFKYSLNSLLIDYKDSTLIKLLRMSSKDLYNNQKRSNLPTYLYTLYSFMKENNLNYSLLNYKTLDYFADQIESGKISNDTLKEMLFTVPDNLVSDSLLYIGSSEESIKSSNDSIVSILKASAQYAHEKFLDLPAGLPERVREKTIQITSPYTNNYDKLKAIEKYLSTNFSYTLTPDEVPEGYDFVDYFLFESKIGYCTYFSTSMAVMARCIGIPSRYVRGYMYPSSANTKPNYTITNMEAHAWIEVYLEGFGWIPFEPTTSFTGIYYEDEEYEGNFSSDFLRDEQNTEYVKNLEKYNKNLIGYNDTLNRFKRWVELTKDILLYILFFLILLILIALFIVGINRYRSKVTFKKYSIMENRLSIIAMYKYYLSTFSLIGYTIQSGETALQFANRIDSRLLFDTMSFRKLTKGFMVSRYSDKKIEEPVKLEMIAFRQDLLKVLKIEMSVYKYYFFKYLLNKF